MIIFDEKKHAEKMIKKGFSTKHKNIYELYILAKYYFLEEDVSDNKVKDKLIKFCETHIEHFNKDEWYKIINKTLYSAKKAKLITGKEVHITKKELNAIKQMEKLNEQKVAFAMLVLYKFYGCKKFEISIEDLYRLCKLNLNSKTKLEILQSLTSKELIDITMGGKRWVKFIDKKGDSVINIKNFDDFIYEYLRYIGEGKFGNCQECEKIIKITTGNKKFCGACAKKNKRKQDRIADKKYKSKKRES